MNFLCIVAVILSAASAAPVQTNNIQTGGNSGQTIKIDSKISDNASFGKQINTINADGNKASGVGSMATIKSTLSGNRAAGDQTNKITTGSVIGSSIKLDSKISDNFSFGGKQVNSIAATGNVNSQKMSIGVKIDSNVAHGTQDNSINTSSNKVSGAGSSMKINESITSNEAVGTQKNTITSNSNVASSGSQKIGSKIDQNLSTQGTQANKIQVNGNWADVDQTFKSVISKNEAVGQTNKVEINANHATQIQHLTGEAIKNKDFSSGTQVNHVQINGNDPIKQTLVGKVSGNEAAGSQVNTAQIEHNFGSSNMLVKGIVSKNLANFNQNNNILTQNNAVGSGGKGLVIKNNGEGNVSDLAFST